MDVERGDAAKKSKAGKKDLGGGTSFMGPTKGASAGSPAQEQAALLMAGGAVRGTKEQKRV
jgi:hypothetical protein